jgi:hypothetical protein
MSDATNAALLSVTASVTVFTALLPPFSEVRKATGNADMTNDVRMGELASGVLVVAIGLTASSMTKSPVPAMTSVVFAAALVCMYESVLAATPKELTHV